MSENTTEQKEIITKEETVEVTTKEEIKENNSEPKEENNIEDNEKENEEKEEEDDEEKEEEENKKEEIKEITKEIKTEQNEKDNENEDEENEEDDDDNELVDNTNTQQNKEEKKETVKNVSVEKENIDNNEKEKEEINEDKKEEMKAEDKKEELKTEDKKEEIKAKDKKEEEKIENINEDKKEEIKEDKEEDKKEEKEEDKVEDKNEDKKEEKEEEITIIKKKITLKLPEENQQKEEDVKENKDKENNEKDKRKQNELNPSDEKKEENKIPSTSSRTRYTFASDNKDLNDAEKAKNNLINDKKNHAIYITIVPSTKKETQSQSSYQNQPKNNISKPTNIQNKYNISSQRNKTPIKSISNNTQQQKFHQEPIKNVKTDQKINYQRKYEISKPTVINNINMNKPKERVVIDIPENNKISYISQQKNQNLQQNQPKVQTSNRRTYTNPATLEKDIRIIKENKTQNNYNQPKKYEVQKPLRDTQKPIKVDISKRNATYVNPTNINNSVNYVVESKYIKKELNQPTSDIKSKYTQQVYPRVKIDISKYNTEKKPITSNSLFAYNSRTLDNKQKNAPRLKYYEKCPNCGYHLNDFVGNI